MSSTQVAAAKTFRALHQGPELLILPNVWDAGSARLFESVGARAIATTSAGVAWAQGFPDGDALPMDRLVATVQAIVDIIRVPLTVDAEGGYSEDPATVGENVARLLSAGAVGVNLEDGVSPPELLAAKIERVKQAAARLGLDVFVNARTDVYLQSKLVPPEHRLEETLSRAARYQQAGADGLFVPGVMEAADIQAITRGTPLPVNVMARPNLAGPAELQRMGVRRLSAGIAIAASIYGRAEALAKSFLHEGHSAELFNGAASYPTLNGLMTRR
ncbi:isocitrate lyase/PEP mutase family protein [Corallococcus llansteffanensis]|uniref:Isocitrate lyase/phosphoenolpyruvate mutase family protein n=1 Tax=Corallococcus llansteffanensis TaxID=2316731 RepID=A0A3A8NE95_9BACT|nr:isocitrate lyase/phosphoenolpyruvate mutase family protein [Corallococcus llansteffanensis]RKH42647.1 isocitrate lyase/phosphoenolpyruvate mutase family protein [Corallococcus llansteffanensis]